MAVASHCDVKEGFFFILCIRQQRDKKSPRWKMDGAVKGTVQPNLKFYPFFSLKEEAALVTVRHF